MFSENLRAMRKEKGYTQEELAIKLNVVRQTVSKWEKGLSVPDADLLETPVSRLLGERINEAADKNEIAEQLAKISEQLAIKNRRSKKLWKTIGITILVIVALYIVLMVVSFFAFTTVWHTTTERIESIELDEPVDGEEGMN